MTLTPLDPDAVAAHLRPPPLADLADKAGRRTRRRRVAGTAAVLATLVAAVVVTGPFGMDRPDRPTIGASPVTRPTETYVSPDLAGGPGQHLYMIPLDRTTAVSVDRTGCRITVRVTTDAGRNWTAPGGPPALENCTPDVDLTGSISYLVVDTRAYRFTISGRSWFTTDAGRTWTTPPEDRVVDSFAPGRPGTSLDCEQGCDRPGAVDPATGGLLVLRRNPPFDRLVNAVWGDQDTIWVVSRPEPGRRPQISHSGDRGRTWSAPMDLPATDDNVNIVASGPGRAYVRWLTREARFRIYRTDDGGGTWTELDLPENNIDLTGTATGRLIFLGSGATGPQVWVSVDHGATFTGPMPLDVPAPLSGGTYPGLAVTSGDDHVLHVHDGTGWYAIQPPA